MSNIQPAPKKKILKVFKNYDDGNERLAKVVCLLLIQNLPESYAKEKSDVYETRPLMKTN